MNEEDSVLVEATPRGIATVTLNRPHVHNAFNEDLIEQLDAIFADLATQDGVRAVVLRASGKSFSAGADLKWMQRASEWTAERNLADSEVFGRMLHALDRMPKPTLALVQGQAYGGGIGLIAACDIAIAVEEAVFSLSEVKLGLIPAVISPYVIRAIGPRHARRLFLTAERFGAADAQRIGLVHAVVPDGEVLAATGAAIIDAILAAAPGAVAAAKDLIATVADRPIDAKLIGETARRIAEQRQTPEGREGIAAFLGKRKPNWVE